MLPISCSTLRLEVGLEVATFVAHVGRATPGTSVAGVSKLAVLEGANSVCIVVVSTVLSLPVIGFCVEVCRCC